MNKKRRQRMLALNEKPHSNAWLIATLMVVFFYLYRVLMIHSVVAMDMLPLWEFWYSNPPGGWSLMQWINCCFYLIALWAVLEILLALIGCFKDKLFCILINGTIVALVVLLMHVFVEKQQAIEYMACKRDLLTHPLFNKQWVGTLQTERMSLKRAIRCSNPEYYLRNSSIKKLQEVDKQVWQLTKDREGIIKCPRAKP